MNGRNNGVDKNRNNIEKQSNTDAQKSFFGNKNNSSHSSQNSSSQKSPQKNSPLKIQGHHYRNSQVNQMCQQKLDLQNINKQFNNKHYSQVLDLIQRYINLYDPRNPHYNGSKCNNSNCSTHKIQSNDKMDIDEINRNEENEIIMLMQTKSDCFFHLNRYEDFFHSQDEIFARDDSQIKVFISKGSIYSQMKRYKESLGEFEKYVSLAPNDENAYYLKGLVEEKLKLYEESLKSFNQSLSINSTQIKVVQKKISVLAALQKFDEAIEDQKRVIQHFENNHNKQNSKQMYQQYFMMGKLYFHTNRIKDSFEYLEKVISQKCDHSETYYYLGECFRCMDQLENAIECYEKAALYDCNNQLAIQRREEIQKRYIQENPVKHQQLLTSNSRVVQEEVITLDDIRKGIFTSIFTFQLYSSLFFIFK